VQVTGRYGGNYKNSVLTAYNIVRSKFREIGVPEKPAAEQLDCGSPLSAHCGTEGRTFGWSSLRDWRHPPKLEAAVRRGRKRVIIPAADRKDLDKVAAEVRRNSKSCR
jgi:hypothetical protein